MSAFVLSQEEISRLTQATDAALRLNQKYPGSYHLADATVDLLGKYAGDLHNVYRALYITNIKAVNGRYNEQNKTLPKYKTLRQWDIGRVNTYDLKKACGTFGCYLYQISEDPIYGSPVYKAFNDINNMLCALYVSKTVDWDGNDEL